jgi:sugar phosphate isomerase/epimerase
MLITRRSFGLLAGSGVAAAARLLAAKKIPMAVQLYSVREAAAKDLPGVLAQVKKLGFDGVEFAGYYGHDAKAVRKLLDDNGLKVAGAHIGLNTLLGDELPKTIEFNKTIGNKNLIVPGLDKKYTNSIAAWKDTAKLFSEIAVKAKPAGMVVGYHNHKEEFEQMEGQMPMAVFLDTASKDVVGQLDVGHARRAGADPVAFAQKYKDRIVSIHIKEFSPDKEDAPLGEGVVEWPGVFKALESGKGLEWYIVEEEAKPKEFTDVTRAIQTLRKWGK